MEFHPIMLMIHKLQFKIQTHVESDAALISCMKVIFFGKLIERTVLKRLDDHMSKNKLQNDHHQDGYKKNHDTETMILKLLQISKAEIGLDGNVLKLFESFFSK